MKRIEAIRKIAVALIFATQSLTAISDDLFQDREPVNLAKGAAFVNGTTIGGYPIFTGGEKWRLINAISRDSNTLRDATSVTFGTVVLEQREANGDWFGNLALATDIAGTGGGKFMAGNPCAGNHMVTVNKGKGYEDNCLTIDANYSQAGTRMVTYFETNITQTRIGGRVYAMKLQLSAELLGFRETSVTDWNNLDLLESSPSRKAFIQKFQTWAELLQNATDKAVDYSKPSTAFDNIPSYRTLLPTPNDLADGTFSQKFIGAVESTRFKPTFRAIAYSKTAPGRIRWHNEYGMGSQEVAEKMALENCEKGRASTAPPCRLYDLDKLASKATP